MLKSHQCCNLSTNNLVSFVNVELPDWNEIMQDDKIIGFSLTDMMDMINKTNMSYDYLGKLLKHLRELDDDEEYEIIDKECANGVCPIR